MKTPNPTRLISLDTMANHAIHETLLSRPNGTRDWVEKRPAKPLARQPSTAHGDLEPRNGLGLCLMLLSMNSSVL